jgi:glycogen debranching enzyme GlgX/4-alpha-glucanotransferase
MPGRVSEGAPELLGVSLAAGGVNVAVRSEHAFAIEFCLFNAEGRIEVARIPLPGRTGPVFHGHVAGVTEGARYGLRAHGPHAPDKGQRFNPDKLLVDPYALALDRPFTLHPSMFGYRMDDPAGGASFSDADSAPFVPKAVVTGPFALAAPTSPAIPWGETVIYELHVRGFTRAHPDIPEAIRGTFAGLAHPAAIAHLKALGVTTVELMPAAAWIDERSLGPLGLTNYWGYNPVAFMVPDPRLAPGGWAEVRTATDALAAAGIETVLDVVFNHTGEGDALGPTLSLRGLDNAAYYRLNPDDPSRYVNDAGTGNTLALDRPAALRLAMDALRAWRRLGGMAGFRFDLASVLGRRDEGFDPVAPLISAIDQDPELRALKLIAEPWDIGPGGYQLGAFPAAWGEWNDRFRDTVRGFWRGDGIGLGEMARRIAGSQDVFTRRHRPSRSLNFVVAHDGFTLADLVSHAAKHNLANGEANRDGTDDNRSWNNGVEGATDDPAIQVARRGDQRALLASLILARGTPMLSMGAELGQSQGGNNNAYAQDNATSWLDWARADAELMAFATRLIDIRRRRPALRADRFLTGEAGTATPYPDVAWRRADGAALEPADWDDAGGEALVMVLAEPDGDGLDRAIVVTHRGGSAIEVALPEPRDGHGWTILADSADPGRAGGAAADLSVSPRSVVVLGEAIAARRRPRPDGDPRALDRLARAAGIATDWWSVDGERHPVSPDTERALLAAMRLPAGTTQQALESLHRLAEEHDCRTLPYALVRRVGEPVTLTLTSPPGHPVPRTWLAIEGDDGRGLRLRAASEVGAETLARGRDGRTRRGLDITLPPLASGRYRVEREDRPGIICHLTIAPAACYAPEAIAAGRRLFGLTAQLYSLSRTGDQGIGDFTTLGDLAAASAREGAAILGINPLHALFLDRRDRASPYYPSDRRFVDPIYLDLDEVTGAPRDPALIDYPAVWAAKAAALGARFAKAARDPGLDAFIAAGGEALKRFATFQAITETLPGKAWRDWPADLREADGPGVAAFAAANPDRVRFHQYLQWLCEGQLAGAAERASGLELGICRDLAVGAAPDGAEAWAQAALLAEGVSIGAPPDPLGPLGQVWGLPPFCPHRLRADGYRSVGALFAANMRHAGALRIDHVMGLARQFWVPDGADGADGAYVDFPLGDLIGALALESERAKCLVIGEDLGTVPHGLRETLDAQGVLSYRVLPFERVGAAFKPPEAYPRLAWACVATHDLPPLAGWWEGLDIEERLGLGQMTPAEAAAARAERGIDRAELVKALAEKGRVDAGADADATLTPELAAAIHAYIAETPSVLALVQVEDLAGEREPVNLPGTDTERPNWRRRVGVPLERLFEAPGAKLILEAMRAARD